MLQRIIICLMPALLMAMYLKPANVFPQPDFLASQGVISVLRELEGDGQAQPLAQQKNLQATFRSTQSVYLFLKERLGSWPSAALWDLAKDITTLSYRHDFPPEFVLSLIQVESNYRVNAVSPKGAIGLLQLKESTARDVARRLDRPWGKDTDLHNTEHNIDLALVYLKELRQRFKKPHAYLSAYNHGPGKISQKLKDGEPLPQEYYQRVMSNYRQYRIEGRRL